MMCAMREDLQYKFPGHLILFFNYFQERDIEDKIKENNIHFI